jgi:uncharacterized membrane protein YdjX (TVP38/TMEM64 family)
MCRTHYSREIVLPAIVIAGIFILLAFLYRVVLWDGVVWVYEFLTDRERFRTFIISFGPAAPVAFIIFQILQVVFAPVPGEVTGFMGGYIFGTWAGFAYSTIGLTLGSWINFVVGRIMGRAVVRKIIPSRHLEQFDKLLRRKGLLVLLALFIFPGFPKDYLCLFLGLSRLPMKLFLILSLFGRIPGTFFLSLQGASLFDKMYGFLGITTLLCLLIFLGTYHYREKLYAWADGLRRGEQGDEYS